jgi:ATP-dependent DNA helicase DinG
VIGPERGSKGRRRGLSARLADLASYDEAGGKAIAAARGGRGAARRWLAAAHRRRQRPIRPDRGAARRSARDRWHARDESGGQEAGYGLETEAAQLDGPFIELRQAGAGRAGRTCASR